MKLAKNGKSSGRRAPPSQLRVSAAVGGFAATGMRQWRRRDRAQCPCATHYLLLPASSTPLSLLDFVNPVDRMHNVPNESA